MRYIPECKWSKDTEFHQMWAGWFSDAEPVVCNTAEEAVSWIAWWEATHGEKEHTVIVAVKLAPLFNGAPSVTIGQRDYRIVTDE